MKLSYPFRLYPLTCRNILTNYISNEYVNQAVDLLNFIKTVRINRNSIVVLIIGSLLDDKHNFNNDSSKYQHIPRFIHNFILEGNYVEVICISGYKKDNTPELIKQSNSEYNWDTCDNVTWRSKNFQNLSYSFFNTLFPEYIDADFAKVNNKNIYLYENNCKTAKRIPKLYFRNHNYINNFTHMEDCENNKYYKINKSPLEQFNQIPNHLPNDNDKIFVDSFHNELNDFISYLKDRESSLLILNYAVFYDNWACTSPYYFFDTFYNNFRNRSWYNVKILNYEFTNNSTNLVDDLRYNYSYENNFLQIKLGRNETIRINKIDKIPELPKFDEISVNNQIFTIIPIEDDGNCMFNSIIKQFNNSPISVKDAREYVVTNILLKNDIQTLIKEELYTRIEYSQLLVRKSIDFVFDLHLYFMKEGPYSDYAQYVRKHFDLPPDVFYGGTFEMSLLGNLFKVNIKIINFDNKLIDIFNHKESYKNIFVKFYGCHYDIAKLSDNIFKSYKLNEIIPFQKVENKYFKATDKFFDLNL